MRRSPAAALAASLLLPLSSSLAGCAATPHRGGDGLRELTRLMVGDYFSALDTGVKEGRPVYMRMRAIESPVPGTAAVYSEMRHDGPQGEFYRQRVYLFDTAAGAPLVSRALSFDDRDAAAGLASDPTLWVKNGLKTHDALPAGCEVRWTRQAEGFLGTVDPAACLITGKRGDQRRIESKTLITAKSIGQLERGYDLEGKLLFGGADGKLNTWPRVDPKRR